MVVTSVLSLIGLGLVAVVYRSQPSTGEESAAEQIRVKIARKELLLVLLAGLIWVLFNVAFAIILGFAPGLLVASGNTVVAASSMVSVVSWLLLLSLPVGGYLAERLRRPNVVLVACFTGIGLCSILLALWPNPVPMLVALGLLFGPPAGIIMALPVGLLPPEHRAPGMGLFFTCYYAGMPALTALAGFSRDATGNPAAPLLFGALLILMAIGILALFRTLQRHGARA